MSTVADKTGFVVETPDEYHASTGYWSRGMLWEFLQRRSVCYQTYILGTAPEQRATKAMDIGTLAHAALLEPHRLESMYTLYPANILAKNGAVSTNEAKAFRDEREAAGQICLKAQDFETVIKMSQAVTNKVGRWLTDDAKIEHSIYWHDKTGLPSRCRPDVLIVRDELCLCIDIKSTADITPQWFRKRVEDGGYWLQDAHYSEGIEQLTGKRPRFVFVVVESEWPYECVLYEIREADRAQAFIKRQQIAYSIAGCLESGDWSDDWSADINTLSITKWGAYRT